MGNHKKSSRGSESNGGTISHCGWLTKQGGARGGFKNWKKRWFEIKRDCIFYYKARPVAGAEDEQPVLGVLPLSGAAVFAHDATTAADDKVKAVCYECKRTFNMIYKRQKCSICSESFCKDCASLKVAVPSFGFDKPVKVCRRCYNSVVGSQATVKDIGQDNAKKAILSRIATISGDRQFAFLIHTPDRELLVHADTAEEYEEWVSAIRSAIARQTLVAEIAKPVSQREHWEIDYSQLTFLTKIGDGAFGEVFKGRLWGTDVAIKKLKDSEVDDKVLADLKNEVAILSQLRHPNVVLYIGACTVPPNVCIVTEWCDRGSLYDIIYKQKAIIDTRKIIDIATGLAQGMSYLHSLERSIIHRDLKSHNVLLDQNFTVKIADFGLSHVRELAEKSPHADPSAETDEAGGKYGVFGTPEWMAPEVMEGSAYTNKIDIYSFGVVLTELTARQIPLRDRYKITSYVYADRWTSLKPFWKMVLAPPFQVLHRPRTPDWIGPTLTELINDCFNVLPSKRPTFMDIIARLTHMFHKSSKTISKEFDVPRLTYMLENSRQTMQELAARELAQMKPSCEPCGQCGSTQSSLSALDDDVKLMFVEKLVCGRHDEAILLSIGPPKVANQCCAALVALLTCARDTTFRSASTAVILKELGLAKLLGYCESPDEELKASAKKLAIALTPDLMTIGKDAVNELDRKLASKLESIVTEEMSSLSGQLTHVQSLLDSKRALLNNLQKTSLPGREHRLKKPPSNAQRISNSPTTEEQAPILQIVAGQIINMSFAAPDLTSIPRPRQLSPAFMKGFNLRMNDLRHYDLGLIYDQATDQWQPSLILLFDRELHVFEARAGQSTTDECLAIVRIVDNPNTRVLLGRKGSKPHCVHICEDQDSIVFCARSLAVASLWTSILAPESFTAPAMSPPVESISQRALLDMLSEVALRYQIKSNSTNAWVLSFDPQIQIWFPCFASLADDGVMMLYETSHKRNPIVKIRVTGIHHNSKAMNRHYSSPLCNPDEPSTSPTNKVLTKQPSDTTEWMTRQFEIEGTVLSLVESSPKATKQSERVADRTQFAFCAQSIGERHTWLQQCRRVISGTTTIDPESVSDSLLMTIPQDLKDQLRRNELSNKGNVMHVRDVSGDDDGTLGAPPYGNEDLRPAATDLRSFPQELEVVEAGDGDDVIPTNANVGFKLAAHAEFVRQFGEATKHGYLLKRGGFRRNWKLRYFYLVGNQLRYFPSHNSFPSECLGIIYTATGSGKRFEVYADKARRQFCFCIENPSRVWHLEAQSEAQMLDWMRCIREAAASMAAEQKHTAATTA
uniref:non-specific serine/threonine protein kinase n=1 Tax=Plasmodiophora brassicae TaxID=37360 RepID=A0A2L2BM77_PLABS|nr:MAPKKK4 [Plasmodiophora brassicae]